METRLRAVPVPARAPAARSSTPTRPRNKPWQSNVRDDAARQRRLKACAQPYHAWIAERTGGPAHVEFRYDSRTVLGVRAIARERLRRLRLTDPRGTRPEEAVAWCGAIQAQDFPSAKWAIALRLRAGAPDASIARAIDE